MATVFRQYLQDNNGKCPTNAHLLVDYSKHHSNFKSMEWIDAHLLIKHFMLYGTILSSDADSKSDNNEDSDLSRSESTISILSNAEPKHVRSIHHYTALQPQSTEYHTSKTCSKVTMTDASCSNIFGCIFCTAWNVACILIVIYHYYKAANIAADSKFFNKDGTCIITGRSECKKYTAVDDHERHCYMHQYSFKILNHTNSNCETTKQDTFTFRKWVRYNCFVREIWSYKINDTFTCYSNKDCDELGIDSDEYYFDYKEEIQRTQTSGLLILIFLIGFVGPYIMVVYCWRVFREVTSGHVRWILENLDKWKNMECAQKIDYFTNYYTRKYGLNWHGTVNRIILEFMSKTPERAYSTESKPLLRVTYDI